MRVNGISIRTKKVHREANMRRWMILLIVGLALLAGWASSEPVTPGNGSASSAYRVSCNRQNPYSGGMLFAGTNGSPVKTYDVLMKVVFGAIIPSAKGTLFSPK